jgi:hypothetical protein
MKRADEGRIDSVRIAGGLDHEPETDVDNIKDPYSSVETDSVTKHEFYGGNSLVLRDRMDLCAALA